MFIIRRPILTGNNNFKDLGMTEINVKQALAALVAGARLTQEQIAAELGCTQENVHYHLHNKARRPRTPFSLAVRVQRLVEKHRIAVPGLTTRAGAN